MISGTFVLNFRSYSLHMISMRETLKKLMMILMLFASVIAHQNAIAQVTAEFTANTTSGCGPLIVNFENQSIGSGLSYEWTGNGNTSVSKTLLSALTLAPTISLTVTGPGGTDTEVSRLHYGFHTTYSRYLTVSINRLLPFYS